MIQMENMQSNQRSYLDLKRIFRTGWLNFRRAGMTSAASAFMMVITLSVLTALIFLNAILTFSLNQIQEKVDITVFFVPSAIEEDVLALKSTLETLPEVKIISYTSKEEALQEFRERHANDALTLQALDELDRNPLGAKLDIRARETSQYESIANFLDNDPVVGNGGLQIVDKVNYFQNKLVIEKLTALISGAKKLGGLVSLLLITLSILITLNTIRLTTYIAKEEITVMRLVGADNKYIRGPFMVMGLLYGIVAATITMLIFLPITAWLGNTLTAFWGINIFTYYGANFFQLFIILLLSGSLIGVASSIFAIRRYLRV